MGTVRDLTTARNATARNATARNAITRVVETTPNPVARRQRGRVVMQIDDPDMNADAGEQLSLTDLSDSPGLCDVAVRDVAVRDVAVRDVAVVTSTLSKSSSRKTATKIPDKAAKASRTTSKARQKLTGEAIAVPIELPPVMPVVPASASPELTHQVEQMAATIATLQNRLADLRLPDLGESPIERTQTIAQAQAIYELVEARAAARKLQPAAAAETRSAHQVAQTLRRPELPPTPPTSLPPRTAQPTGRSGGRSRPRSTAKPSRRRFSWDASQLAANLSRLGTRWVPIPRDPATKVVDAMVWVLVSIGLRIVGKLLVGSLPFLAGPVNLLLALPAIVAAYLAFCVANSRTDVIYRLLLTTLGLFLGSRF